MDPPSDLPPINDAGAYIPQPPPSVQPSGYPASYLPQLPYNIFAPQSQTSVAPVQMFPPGAVEPVAQVDHSAAYPDLNHGSNSMSPTYAEMITAAIAALREKAGSSRQAIARYIETHYPNLPQSHSNMLTQALKRLKNSGQLVMIKHSYALPSSAPVPLTPLASGSSPATGENQNQSTSVSASKRGPGRPSKLKPQVHPNGNGGLQPVSVAPSEEPVSIETVTVEPVSMESESMLVSLGLVDEGPKRGRGRPPKAVTAEQQQAPQTPKAGASESGGSSLGKRGRGRPPMPKSFSDAKRGRGRPPRTASLNSLVTESGKKGRGRPKRNALAVVNSSGKRRGRPRKNVALLGGAGGVLLAKRPGRPPKAGGAKKARKLSGRPLGRPKKDASVALIQASSPQQEMAYQDLKSKAEHLQSRIKHTISVVKPYFNTEVTESAVGGALRELEELASMDLTAPTTNDIVVYSGEPVPQN